MALANLEANLFDVTKTIKKITDDYLSLTQRILNTFGNKEDALNRASDAIEQTYKLKREHFWLNYEELEKLEWELYCLVSTMEWINYSDYEGIDYGLDFHIDHVIANLVKLGLVNTAAKFRHTKLNPDSYSFAEYSIDKTIILNKLYELVLSNIEKFPK